jgi:hypothetical protein
MFSFMQKINLVCKNKPRLPKESYFPEGTEFLIKEFDVPIARIPDGANCKYQNWFGGQPRPYSFEYLKVGNNWPATSFEEWIALVKASVVDEAD